MIRVTGPPTQLHRLVARTCSAFYGDNHPHSTARCRLAEQQARLTASAAGANTTHASVQLQLEASHTTAHASTVYSNAAYSLWPWRELRVRLGPAQLTVDTTVRNECRRLKVPGLHCLEALRQADAALEGIHSKYRERCRLRRELSKRTGVAVEWRTAATTGAIVEPVSGQHSGIEWTAVAPRVKSSTMAWEMYQRGVTTAPTLSPEDATRWPPPPVESSLPANHTAALQSQLRHCMQSTRLRDLPFGSVYHHYVEISREKSLGRLVHCLARHHHIRSFFDVFAFSGGGSTLLAAHGLSNKSSAAVLLSLEENGERFKLAQHNLQRYVDGGSNGLRLVLRNARSLVPGSNYGELVSMCRSLGGQVDVVLYDGPGGPSEAARDSAVRDLAAIHRECHPTLLLLHNVNLYRAIGAHAASLLLQGGGSDWLRVAHGAALYPSDHAWAPSRRKWELLAHGTRLEELMLSTATES